MVLNHTNLDILTGDNRDKLDFLKIFIYFRHFLACISSGIYGTFFCLADFSTTFPGSFDGVISILMSERTRNPENQVVYLYIKVLQTFHIVNWNMNYLKTHWSHGFETSWLCLKFIWPLFHKMFFWWRHHHFPSIFYDFQSLVRHEIW